MGRRGPLKALVFSVLKAFSMSHPIANTELKTAPRPRLTLRAFWVRVHRYTGLAIATFIVVAALTGSAITFYKELDALINPGLLRVEPPTPHAQPLEPLALRERVLEQIPEISMDTLVLDHDRGYSTTYWQRMENGEWRTVHVDPYTGAVLGFRTGASLANGIEYLMPFLYRLHYELALGSMGYTLLGIVSLLWSIDCFVGLYLTFPLRSKTRSKNPSRSSWLARWKPSWLMKTGHLFSTIFTFHRAAGLWLWALLFVFAWSGVGFNLGPVYYPVMSFLGSAPDVHGQLPQLEEHKTNPALDWPSALATARTLMATEAKNRNFLIKKEGWLGYESDHGAYQYRVHSTHDVGTRYPGTRLWFDGDTGELYGFYAPTGMATGETITSWLFALHMATVGGLPYRIFVVILGLTISALALSGIWIWWRKRRTPKSKQ